MNKVAVINTSKEKLELNLINELNDPQFKFEVIPSKGPTVWNNLPQNEQEQSFGHLIIGQFKSDNIADILKLSKQKIQQHPNPGAVYIAFSHQNKKSVFLKSIIQRIISFALNTKNYPFIFDNKLTLLVSTSKTPSPPLEQLEHFQTIDFLGTEEKSESIKGYLRYIFHLVSHLNEGLIQLVLFGCVGISGMIIDLSVVTFIKETFNVDTRLCSVLSFPVALTTNYILNRRWTFRDTSSSFIGGYIKYFGINLFGLTTRIWTIHFILYLFPRSGEKFYLFVTMMGILIAFFINFFSSKFLVFSKKN